jgi:hypothetical protein
MQQAHPLQLPRSRHPKAPLCGPPHHAGWVHTAWTKTPYTWRLEELLRSKYPGRQIELVNGGIGSAGVLDRLRPGGDGTQARR